MHEIFISYANDDEQIARFVQLHLSTEGVKAFLASTSVEPGEKWSNTVLAALKQSRIVVFLASAKACNSAYVQQELGIAIGDNKEVIPVIWNISPEQLPGWIQQLHTLDLRKANIAEAQAAIAAIATRLKEGKIMDLAKLVALILAGVAIFGKR